MATFLLRPCLFLTLWMAGSRRPAIARTVDSDPCVMYTGLPRYQTQRETASRRGNLASARLTAPVGRQPRLTFEAAAGDGFSEPECKIACPTRTALAFA